MKNTFDYPALQQGKLLPMQEAILFDCELMGSHAVYTVEVPLKWKGAPPDMVRWQQAFKQAVLAHDAFRLRIRAADGSAAQWEQVPGATIPPDIRPAGYGRQPIDPFQGPCMELVVEKQDQQETLFLIRFHHVAADRTSIEMLVADMAALYAGRMPDPPGDYSTAVAKVLEAFDQAVAQESAPAGQPEQRGYAPAQPAGPHLKEEEGGISRVASRLEASSWKLLEKWGREAGLSPQALTLAAYLFVMLRLSDSDTTVAGIPCSLHDLTAQPRTAGCFMNMLSLTASYRPDAGFLDFACSIRDILLAALPGRCRPLLGQAGLFEHVFVWHDPFTVHTGDATLELGIPNPYPARLTHSLLAQPAAEGLLLAVDADPGRMSGETASAILHALVRTLEAVAVAPRLPLDTIALGTAVAATLPAAPAEDIITRIWRQMEKQPDAVAITGQDGTSYSFGRLSAAAESVAAWALEAAGPGSAVGLCLPRSFSMVAALLGLLKSGQHAALLDPAASPAVLRAGIQAGRISCLLTDRNTGVEGVKHIAIDTLIEKPATAAVTVAPGQGGVLLFSSGTTGMPKPILLSRASISQHAAWAMETFDLSANDRVLQFCSVAFDAMLEEVLPALAAGATLVLRDEWTASSAAAFTGFCSQHRISVIDLPTGFFNLVATELEQGGLPLPGSLRLVVIGGEGYTNRAANTWHALLQASNPAARLVTTYGPAEATVVVAARELAPSRLYDRPLVGEFRLGSTGYVLDKNMNPVPPGITGELFLGGDTLAKGYFRQAAASAASFLPDPFSAQAGARMYRTGDRVLQQQDGSLLFMGRADRQLKRSGMRIAPEAIEHAFEQAFEGAPCGVVPYGDALQHIAVFIQVEQEAQSALRIAAALESLPAAAHPSVIRFEQLPLTGRGKTDLAALRSRLTQDSGPAVIEAAAGIDPVLSLVAEALGRTVIGAEEDFFAAGGHSLAVLRLIGMARRALHVSVPVRSIYQARTAGAIAGIIRSAPPQAFPSPAPDAGAARAFSEFERAILIDEQLVTGKSPYWIKEQWRLTAAPDPDRLYRAAGYVLSQHPVLRACPVLDTALPVWQDREVTAALPGIFNGDPSSYLQLSLENAPDLPVMLTLTAHHCLLDGLGLERFMAALAAAYTRNVDIPASPVRELPATPVPRELDAGWKTYLSGIGQPPCLPPDRPGNKWESAATFAFLKSDIHVDRLYELQQGRPGCFTAALALASAWLHRMTGSNDVLLGYAVGLSEGLDGIRMATCVAPLRSQCALAAPFLPLYNATRDKQDWLLDHLPVKAAALAACLRSAGAGAAIPFLFDLQDKRKQAALHFGTVEAECLGCQPDTARADIEISFLIEQDGKLCFSIRGRSSCYSREMLEAWVASLEYFVYAVIRYRDAPLQWLPLINMEAPAAAVMDGPCGPGLPEMAAVPHLLRQALEKQGAAPAIIAPQLPVSGAVALEHAAAVTHGLQQAGVVAGDRVLIVLPRNPLYPAALLGVWEAAAVPVLIHPDQPEERQQAMRRRTLPAAVIALAADGKALAVSRITPAAVKERKRFTGSTIGMAYITFTSGSQGAPKPVACTWTGLKRLLSWSMSATPLSAQDAFLHTAAPGFDIALWEMIFPLVAGARLLVADEAGTGDMAALIRFADREQATHVHFIPALLESFLDALETTEGRSLKLVYCGGDTTPPALQERLLEERGLPMQHCYGPTEATIFMLSWHGNRPSPWPARLPLGALVAGAGIAILDTAGMPVVRGIEGEIGIYGDAVAAGYLFSPRETAQAFRPWYGRGGRIYLTGDRGRMHADGLVAYIGRNDRQVKIAGVRIELGEVEHALEKADGVARAMAVLRKGSGELPVLVAYLKLKDGADAAHTRRQAEAVARERLPAAAVPRSYVLLDEFPLNINGKIDIRQLPDPLTPDADPQETGTATLSLHEEMLSALWRQVLGGDNVKPDENFFRAGGDSMAAIRITTLARKQGLGISLADFFRYPTIRLLAAELGNRMVKEAPLPPATGNCLAPGQAAEQWLKSRHRLDDTGIQSMLISMPEEVGAERWLRAWNLLLLRHDALSMVVRLEQNEWKMEKGAPKQKDQMPVAPNDSAALTSARAQVRPEAGNMAGICMVHGAPARIAIAIHHLATDWQSWQILLRDLKVACQADEGPLLFPPLVSFERWCRHNRHTAIMPGEKVAAGMPREVAKRLLPFAAVLPVSNAGAQRTALLLAAVAQAISALSGQPVVDVDMEHDGRNWDESGLDFSQTVGWLTGFRHLQVRRDGPLKAGWLEAAEHALQLPPATTAAIPAYALNIVPPFSPEEGGLTIHRFCADDTPPAHPAGIEIALAADGLEMTVDCDSSHPPGTAAQLLDLIITGLEKMCRDLSRRIPLTPFQEAMLSVHLQSPGKGLYHTQVLFELEGRVDGALLRQAWAHAMHVHDAFRCRVDMDAGEEPAVIIAPDKTPDWKEYADESRPAEAICAQVLEADMNRPFNFFKGDTTRWYLITGSDGSRLVWSHHHLFFDGWSLNLVVDTVSRSYAALASGGALPGMAPSVAAIARWWQQRDQDAAVQRWLARLIQHKPPPALQYAAGEEHREHGSTTLVLSAADTATLEQLARLHGASLFELVLSAWSLVLAYHTRQKEVLCGVVLSIRPPEVPGIRELAGLCINTLPLLVTVADTFTVLLAAVRDRFREALEDPYLPTGRLLTALRKEGWPANLSTLVVFENYPGDRNGAPLGTAGYLKVAGSREKNEIPYTLIVLPGETLAFELLHGGAPAQQAVSKRLSLQLERVVKAFLNLIKNRKAS